MPPYRFYIGRILRAQPSPGSRRASATRAEYSADDQGGKCLSRLLEGPAISKVSPGRLLRRLPLPFGAKHR